MNHYNEGDVLAPTPAAAISARRDLDPVSPRADGAIDAKIVNADMIKQMSVWAISGPTHQTQPIFAWVGRWQNETKYPHHGHVERFGFDWEVIRASDMQ